MRVQWRFFENPKDDTQEAATNPLRGTCTRLWHDLEVCHALPLGATSEIFFVISIPLLLVIAF